MTSYAYCFRSGEIDFAETKEDVPHGALILLAGEMSALKRRISARARHGYNAEYLVPGVPEEDDDDDALDAALAFTDFISWETKQ